MHTVSMARLFALALAVVMSVTTLPAAAAAQPVDTDVGVRIDSYMRGQALGIKK